MLALRACSPKGSILVLAALRVPSRFRDGFLPETLGIPRAVLHGACPAGVSGPVFLVDRNDYKTALTLVSKRVLGQKPPEIKPPDKSHPNKSPPTISPRYKSPKKTMV